MTAPSSIPLKVLGGLVSIVTDDYDEVKIPQSVSLSTINGTNYNPLKIAGLDYTVAPGKVFHAWGFEMVGSARTTHEPSVVSFGYADDNIGTNYVELVNILNTIQLGDIHDNTAYTNQMTSKIEIPVGKIPQTKITCTGTGNAHRVCKIIGLEVTV